MTSVIMIYALLVVNVSMYVGGAATIATILHLPTFIGILITGAVTILYVAVGGIKGVAYTNVIHASIKYFGLIITTVVALRFSGGSLTHLREVMPPVYFSLTGVGLPTIIAWTIGNIGAVFSTQYVIQAIAAIQDEHKAKQASILAGLLMIPVGLMSAFIGVAAKYVFPQIKGVSAIPTLAARMDPWFGGLVIAGLVAAVFGTVSASTLGSTALVMKDFYVPLLKPSEKHTLIATPHSFDWDRFVADTFRHVDAGRVEDHFFRQSTQDFDRDCGHLHVFCAGVQQRHRRVLGIIAGYAWSDRLVPLGKPFWH